MFHHKEKDPTKPCKPGECPVCDLQSTIEGMALAGYPAEAVAALVGRLLNETYPNQKPDADVLADTAIRTWG